MRVWALASCSGLLALAACSADQSSSPNPSAAPLDGEDTADIQAQPGLTATASSPMARPEVRPRPVIQGGYRLSPASGKPVATAATSGGKALPQAAELRQRLERLRSQQNARLSPSTPLVTAPQSAARVRPAPSRPAVEPAIPAFNPVQSSNFSTQGITPLPTPFRPTPVDPEANRPTASTAAALGEVTTASVARTYPIAPLRHQGYSARAQRPAPVLSVARTAAGTLTATRLHGGTLTAQQAEVLPPNGAIATQVAIVEGSTSPEGTSAAARAIATDAATAELAVGPEVLWPEPEASAPAPLTVSSHQSSGTVALTPAAVSLNGLETSSEAHQSQGVSVGAETVGPSPVLGASAPEETAIHVAPRPEIAPPESLPLTPPSPQANLVRPQPATSVAEPDRSLARGNLSEASATPERILVSSRFPNAARSAAPAPALSSSGAAPGEASAVPGVHQQSPIAPAAVQLIPTVSSPPKGLAIAYCLSPSGQLVPTAHVADGSSASLPKFSSASSTDPSVGDPTVGLETALSKDNPAELCVGMPSTSPEMATPLTLD